MSNCSFTGRGLFLKRLNAPKSTRQHRTEQTKGMTDASDRIQNIA
jgi:hypothetical protein